MHSRRNVLGLAAGAATALISSGARAQAWPQKPVTVIVPFAAGGNTDGIARMAAQRLSDAFGKSFVVENRPGAGGAIAAEMVKKAAAGWLHVVQSPRCR